MTVEFLLTSLVVILLPGIGVLYTIAVGFSHGFRLSVAAALGCTFGIVPAAVASILGLAAIFHTSAIAFVVIKYFGVAYLIYMAWGILQDDGIMQLDEGSQHVDKHTSRAKSYWRVAMNGILLNVLNPKLSLFFLAFLPQFVPPTQNGSLFFMAYLAVVFMAMTFVVFVLYGVFSSVARQYVIETPQIMRWLKRGFAGAFGVLGVKLTLSEL